MKTNLRGRRVATRFRRPARFELEPQFDALAIDSQRTQFEQLKSRLLKPVLNQSLSPALLKQLHLAANEAAAVAWTTPFPLLVLPVLLEEKTDEIQHYAVRQEQVQEATHLLFR